MLWFFSGFAADSRFQVEEDGPVDDEGRSVIGMAEGKIVP